MNTAIQILKRFAYWYAVVMLYTIALTCLVAFIAARLVGSLCITLLHRIGANFTLPIALQTKEFK